MPFYELLVMVRDNVHPTDAVRNLVREKRGDVLDIKPVGFPWSKAEREHPRWTIITADLNDDMKASLLARETKPDNAKEYRMIRGKGVKLELNSLGDLKRQIPRHEIVSAIQVKPRLPEPDELAPPASLAFK